MKIHYFQRYHSKENVDTSNTMLMLSRLYNYNSDKFFSMMNTLMLGENETPEILFDLQVVGERSVADAIISQKSFKIVVETKLYNQFNLTQLINHFSHFTNEQIKILLTLDPKPIKKEFLEEFTIELRKYNSEKINELKEPIKHVHLTFEQLLSAMEDMIDDRDIKIVSVLDDFKKYCLDSGLISNSYKWLRAIVAGTTLKDNIELNIYYDNKNKGYSEHGYIGLYNSKSIQAIGKLIKTVIAYYKDDELIYENENGEEVNNEEKNNIKEAIIRAENYDYNLKTIPHRFFIVDKFYKTNFSKNSKNPIQRSKYFNLAEMLNYDIMPSTETIANELNGKTWEEF